MQKVSTWKMVGQELKGFLIQLTLWVIVNLVLQMAFLGALAVTLECIPC